MAGTSSIPVASCGPVSRLCKKSECAGKRVQGALQRILNRAGGAVKPFIEGMGRVMRSLASPCLFLTNHPTEFLSGNLYNVQAFMLSEKAEKQQQPASAFISLDRGEIHSYVGSKESQAFDTVQLCLQRKAPAGPDHGVLTQGCSDGTGNPGASELSLPQATRN